MFILLFKNPTPQISTKRHTSKAIITCTVTADENIVFSLSLLSRPNSKVIKRLIAVDNEPEITENIATTPPTTL